MPENQTENAQAWDEGWAARAEFGERAAVPLNWPDLNPYRAAPATEEAESGQRVTLTPVERVEAETVIRETFELAATKAADGRSSMPIHISDAALLLGLASVALELIPEATDAD